MLVRASRSRSPPSTQRPVIPDSLQKTAEDRPIRMNASADVLNPECHMTKRARIRRARAVRLVVLNPGDLPPSRRTNPHGWRFANEARRRRGRRKTAAMVQRWEEAGPVFPGNRGVVVATMFGVSRAAAYQRMYRYRRGFYGGDRPPRPRRLDLSLELVWEPAQGPEPDHR